MASTRAEKYKEKREEIEKLNESVAPKKKVSKPIKENASKEDVLKGLGIDTSFGLEERKQQPSSLSKLNKQQEEIYHTQEMKRITDIDIKRESSLSQIVDTMKKDMPLDGTSAVKPAKRTQMSQEFISAKEKYGKSEPKVEATPRPKLVINDNTKKVSKEKEMPKTSATKVMGVDEILEVKAKQNSNRTAPVVKKPRVSAETVMLKVCFGILLAAVVAIICIFLTQ